MPPLDSPKGVQAPANQKGGPPTSDSTRTSAGTPTFSKTHNDRVPLEPVARANVVMDRRAAATPAARSPATRVRRDDVVLITSDSSDDDELFRPLWRSASGSMPPSSSKPRGGRPLPAVKLDESDDEVQFLPDRSKILETLTVEDSPPPQPKIEDQPAPLASPVSAPVATSASPLKRSSSSRDAGTSKEQPASKKPKAEEAASAHMPEPVGVSAATTAWSRFMTINARVDVVPESPAVTAGTKLELVCGRSIFLVFVRTAASEVIGYLDRAVATLIFPHLSVKTIDVEAYAFGAVESNSVGVPGGLAGVTVARTNYLSIGMDLRCKPGEEHTWCDVVKAAWPGMHHLSFNALPASASAQAAVLRHRTALSSSSAASRPAISAAEKREERIGWLSRLQEHIRDLTSAGASAAGSSAPATSATARHYLSVLTGGSYPPPVTTAPPVGPSTALDAAWTALQNPQVMPPTDPNDDDDDDDVQQGQMTGEQEDVMRGLAGSDYRGRNALSALYDEDRCLDVAMLPTFPDLEALMQGRLKTPLKHHQSQGLAWMVKMEHPQLPRRRADDYVMLWRAKRQRNGSARYSHAIHPDDWKREPPTLPRGGIVADDMGLGKTIQIIALCLYDPSGQKVVAAEKKMKDKEERAWLRRREAAEKKKGKGKGKAKQQAELEDSETQTEDELDDAVPIIDPVDPSWTKTTLVVCPLSVIYNWVNQIEEHTRNVKVGVYHGEGAKKMQHTKWDSYDFIITTYSTLTSEFKPIDQIRKAREMAEIRQEEILRLDNKVRAETLAAAYAPTNVQFYRDQLEKVRRTQREELAKWAKKHTAPGQSKLKAAFAKSKFKSTGKGKGKAKPTRELDTDDSDTDFSWSAGGTDDEADFKSAKAVRKGKGKASTSSSASNSKNDRAAAVLDAADEDGEEEYDFDELFGYELPKILRTRYRRAVLDEAHVGRNSRTLLHRAVLELSAERRWAVTGTPLINSTKDLQSLCAFLRIEHLEDRKLWSKVIDASIKNGSGTLGSRLLRTIVICTTLRRTKDMKTLEGRPVVELPPIQMYKHAIHLDPETRAFYDQVATAMRGRVMGLWRAGELANQYSNVLLFLCRLRQICCSRDLVPPNLLEEMQQLLRPPEEGENGESAAPVAELDPATIKRLQEKLRALITTGSEECPICLDALKDARITPCAHTFCLVCITAVIQRQGKCPLDRTPLPVGTPLVALPVNEQVRDIAEDYNEDVDGDSKRPSKEASPLDSEADIDASPAEDSEEVQSSKIDQLVEILKMTERVSAGTPKLPLIKSLCFSNFVSFLDKIADRLREEGIPFCRFVGSMNKAQRAQVLDVFAKPVYLGQQVNSIPRQPDAPDGRDGNGGGSSKSGAGSSKIGAGSSSKTLQKAKVGGSGAASTGKPRTLLDMLDKQIARNKNEEEDELPDEMPSASKTLARSTRGKTRHLANVGYEDGRIPMVMLLSIQAGAVGLNLTAASQCFLLDPWWNSSIEAQAIDRVHRIGQSRDVKVFQFITKDTIEERVMEIQNEKEEMIRNSFAGIRNHGESIDRKGAKKESTIRDILRIFGIIDAAGTVIEDRNGANAGSSGAGRAAIGGRGEGSSGSVTETEPDAEHAAAPQLAGPGAQAGGISNAARTLHNAPTGSRAKVKGETSEPLQEASAAASSSDPRASRAGIKGEEESDELDIKPE